ncbi:MAG: formylglycine-generating enzyme family protein [Planctomycetaceae bacterium]
MTLIDPRPKPPIIRAGTHEFVRIPEGTCEIGAVPDDWDADGDEFPRHTVVVPSFVLSRFEVTAEQFLQFVKESGYTSLSSQDVKDFSPRTWANPGWDDYGPKHPVVNVTHSRGCSSLLPLVEQEARPDRATSHRIGI